jgi:hypothetical protein
MFARRGVFVTERLSWCVGLSIVALATVVPILAQSQALTPVQAVKLSIFLADPQLGVVGAYQADGNTLYFEARTPDGSTQMSARLLDSIGRTVAISGHSMDAQWLAKPDFDAATAAQSLSLAASLPSPLATALPDAVFFREIMALSNLAAGAAKALPASALITMDSATANLPARPLSAFVADQYDAAGANELAFGRDAAGILDATFRGEHLQAVVEDYPEQTNEDGTVPYFEVYARLVASNGTALINQLGGDDAPYGWDDTSALGPAANVDTIQASMNAGNAIRGAALMARFPSMATPDEAEAISRLGGLLREKGLLPQPESGVAPVSPSPAAARGPFASGVDLYAKPLISSLIANHSGTFVYHYYWSSGSWHYDYGTVYCNHGTCPGAGGSMKYKCSYLTPAMGYYRYPPHARITAPPGVGQNHSCYKTPYHLDSGFLPWDHPGHNCNDDSWTQIRAIRGQPEGPGSYRCNDWALDDYAPSCSD